MKKAIKTILITMVSAALIVSGIVAFYLEKDEREVKKRTEFEQYWLNAVEEKKRVNILLMGVDTLEEDTTEEHARTDTMMVLSADPETKTGFILSIPRDSRVKIEGRPKKTKINHAHSKGGIPLAVSTVKKTTGLAIHHYIRVNYQALTKTVDDVGGVDVNVPQDMDWDDYAANLHIHLKAGPQTLNGEQAMQFIRFRNGYANKDLGRIEMQQYFMEMLFRKIISPQSITKIPKYLETMYQYVDTDLSKKELISLAATAIKLDPERIEKKVLPGKAKNINGISYYILDEEKQAELISYLLKGDYPVQKPVVAQEEAPIELEEGKEEDKPLYTIFAYNGSGKTGVARRVSDLLKIEDLPVSYTGNASRFDYQETTVYYKDNEKLAKQVGEILGVERLKEGTRAVDYREPDIVVIIGSDFSK